MFPVSLIPVDDRQRDCYDRPNIPFGSLFGCHTEQQLSTFGVHEINILQKAQKALVQARWKWRMVRSNELPSCLVVTISDEGDNGISF